MADTPPKFDPIRHRRGGRPRKPEHQRRDTVVRVRMNTEEFSRIEARAAAADLSLSAYSRASFSGDTVRIVVTQSAPPEIVHQLRGMGNNLKQALHEARRGNFSSETETRVTQALDAINAELRTLLHGSGC
jgi:hypothetical protein